QNQKEKNIQNIAKPILTNSEKLDLNTATQEELQAVNGIGEVLSKRIVLYRSQIGGFIDDLQLKDIYGLKYETRMALTEKFTVKTPREFEKLDINNTEVVDLMEVPYIKYELARKIVNYRITREGISSFEELAEVQDFPFDRIDRLKLYLKIENP
ncbi:MAG TPA: helix-hairpin-helix domain-containing protein, partial [Flavobacteriaceae bacterium]|nr:helix-hairpin-helix domain-containing protein [Flavobacteriaceae bacterium]